MRIDLPDHPRRVPPGSRRSHAATALLCAVLLSTAFTAGAQDTLHVGAGRAFESIGAAVRGSGAGDVVLVHSGTYREPTIVVNRGITVAGAGNPVLDGEGQRAIMIVTADSVIVRGLRFRNVGTSFTEDRAALRVAQTNGCVIEDNRFDDTFFGIYLAEVDGCRIARNVLQARTVGEAHSGNAIHVWSSRAVEVLDNTARGHRDGIYLEFTRDSRVRGNVAEGNQRYGLHFMYADDCSYERNVFRDNHSGVAVMYARRVTITGNEFTGAWGGASYGLLLKEISDSRLEGNRFERNSTGLVAEGANRLQAERNHFVRNGWAVRVMASTGDARFTANNFKGNTFDVATNSRMSSTTFDGNYWDSYRGYDLNRDGTGDVPHRPVRLFTLVVERFEPALVLLRSLLVGVLDMTERVLPVLTPAAMMDERPSMREIR